MRRWWRRRGARAIACAATAGLAGAHTRADPCTDGGAVANAAATSTDAGSARTGADARAQPGTDDPAFAGASAASNASTFATGSATTSA